MSNDGMGFISSTSIFNLIRSEILTDFFLHHGFVIRPVADAYLGERVSFVSYTEWRNLLNPVRTTQPAYAPMKAMISAMIEP